MNSKKHLLLKYPALPKHQMLPKKQILLALWISMLLLLSACTSSDKSSLPPAPFSQASWESTPQELETLEGTVPETTASVYGGTAYLFPGHYLGYDGTTKYMFDSSEQLVAIAFFYEGSEAGEITEFSKQLYEITSKDHGAGIHSETAGHNSGEKWVRPEGNIILSVLSTADANALQYAFLHPSISELE